MPVKLIWSGEEDILHGTYQPVMQSKLTGSLDEKGNLTGLHFKANGQEIPWKRDPIEMYSFHLTVPAGAPPVVLLCNARSACLF
jgi:hypothetical protein